MEKDLRQESGVLKRHSGEWIYIKCEESQNNEQLNVCEKFEFNDEVVIMLEKLCTGCIRGMTALLIFISFSFDINLF